MTAETDGRHKFNAHGHGHGHALAVRGVSYYEAEAADSKSTVCPRRVGSVRRV